ncbi:MAG: TlpA family protein disulfide reductase [Aggregatilineales bacterium]
MASELKRQTWTVSLKPFNRRTAIAIGLSLVGFVSLVLLILWGLNISASAPATSSDAANNSSVGSGGAAGITLPTVDGQTVALPGNPGQITVLYTMGYWCRTCISGARTLARLQPEYAKRNIRFIAVDVTPQVEATDLPPFLQAVGDNQLTWAMDSSGRFTYLYQINSLDTAIVLDSQGREVYRNEQGSSDTEIRAALDKLLAPAAPCC